MWEGVRWVQVMEHVKIEGVEMKGVYKRLVHIPTLICYIDHVHSIGQI